MMKFSVSVASPFLIRCFISVCFLVCYIQQASTQVLTFVELNCENLFDTRHDEGKNDIEFTPDGQRHWNASRYWRKLNHTGQAILACADDLPDLVALIEVENDSVLHDLTRRSLLRNAGYNYLMTESPDERGIDVALLYQPAVFRPLCYETVSVPLIKNMRPTRDILYVRGELQNGDTLHVFVVHAPSRNGGEMESRPFRMQVAKTLTEAIIQLVPDEKALVVVAGDFNDTLETPSMRHITMHRLISATKESTGNNGARTNYRYQGQWSQIDHVLCSPTMLQYVTEAYVNDAPFLIEEDIRYGGMKPRRTFNGYHYQRGFSDHLPLVVRFRHNTTKNRLP